MPEICAFRGLHYNPAKVPNPADVVTPPYDVISPLQRQEFLNKSPWNVVRLILPEGENPYETANRTLHSWIGQEILIREPDPAIYVIHQKFRMPDGSEKTRQGFTALIRLADLDRGIVLPHESTLSAPKEDRLNLLRACKTNFSPIFGLYSDPEQRIESVLAAYPATKPDVVVVDDGGIVNSMWRVSEKQVTDRICQIMKPHWVLIADGHHRYESCLLYRDEMAKQNPDPNAPFQFTMMFFTNIHHPGIAILPYNRGVCQLPGFDPSAFLKKASAYFEITEFRERDAAELALKSEGSKTTVFLARLQGMNQHVLFRLLPQVRLQDFYPEGTPEVVQRLDVNILHKIVIQNVLAISEEEVRRQTYLKYYKDATEEWNDLESGKLQIAFFLNATRVEQVVDVSRAGGRMPQKSTFFYPKLMTGFVMNQHQ